MKTLVLGLLLSVIPSARAGDCIQNHETDQTLIRLFQKASGGEKVSKRYGNGMSSCKPIPNQPVTEGDFSYRLSDGDHKCLVIFPWDLTELVSTEKLRKTYEDYVRDDVRVWVTSPKGESAILSIPEQVEIRVPQSIKDCITDGPKDFSCGKKDSRKHCCREKLGKRIDFKATFAHPFAKDWKITVTSRQPQITVYKSGAMEQLDCQGITYF
jgi:hypothetical protein